VSSLQSSHLPATIALLHLVCTESACPISWQNWCLFLGLNIVVLMRIAAYPLAAALCFGALIQCMGAGCCPLIPSIAIHCESSHWKRRSTSLSSRTGSHRYGMATSSSEKWQVSRAEGCPVMTLINRQLNPTFRSLPEIFIITRFET
jgi:hypothetical protein